MTHTIEEAIEVLERLPEDRLAPPGAWGGANEDGGDSGLRCPVAALAEAWDPLFEPGRFIAAENIVSRELGVEPWDIMRLYDHRDDGEEEVSPRAARDRVVRWLRSLSGGQPRRQHLGDVQHLDIST